MSFATRFAPSPTGPLHLGHAYSAMVAHDMAAANGGRFLLRIEDIDHSRARPEWEDLIYEDLAWLGLGWEMPVMRQSDRMAAYDETLRWLWWRGLIYPCRCNRRDIVAAALAPQDGTPLTGPDGIVYPGTCRPPPDAPLPETPLPQDTALRLNMAAALQRIGEAVFFDEHGAGPEGETGWQSIAATDLIETVGDVVLARRDMGTSYHLSVVIDDAAQGITHVVRGADLFEPTKIHAVLQRLLDLPTPTYHHHRLIRDDTGKRLAKRDDARAIRTYREEGATPADVRRMVGLGP
ncbi:MAG: tRNA glutamyl-Q(34) synthetase GluQRS [Pseudomonadota bacterium]